MAYNLQSLVQLLEQMLLPDERHRGHNWILGSHDRACIKSLLTKACFLKEFFENSSSITGHEVRRLESRIRDTAYQVEDVIGCHLADKLIFKKKGESFRVSPPTDLLQRIDDHQFESILEDMVKIMDETQMRSDASSSQLVSPERQDLNPNKVILGISDVLLQLKDRLIHGLHSFEVIPIVGMGGIGKTTLAKILYDDQFVASHFDIRAWTTISQSYNVRKIVAGLLKCDSRNSIDEMSHEDKDDKLTVQLHKFLFDRRYLIVLDDMWSSDAWFELDTFFPKTDGSRILVTTREHSVVTCFGSRNLHHQMDFLSEVESWNLLCKIVFREESCPSELEEVGKIIARNCRGLPLAIHAVGGVLSQLGRTQESWVQVGRDVCASLVGDNDGQLSNILSLSYQHLPNYLKPCFLYMSAFPEDYKIQSSKLIKLWVAEGFLKPIMGKSLEEVAEVYLRELVERNLLLVHQQETKSHVKSYVMHDLLRDLCIKKAQEEKFLYVVKDTIQEPNWNDDIIHLRRLKVCWTEVSMVVLKSIYLSSACRTIILYGPNRYFPSFDDKLVVSVLSLKMLCVLDIFGIRLRMLPESVENLVNLRYLATYCAHFPLCSLSNLCNLQTLILGHHEFGGKILDLFDMPQLRHLKFKEYYCLYGVESKDSVALQENLQTLSTIMIGNSFPKILEATPNLKKLGIVGKAKYFETSFATDLTRLSKLETLKCTDFWFDTAPVNFPPSLRRLTLRNCKLPSMYMERVGALPNLQMLKLQMCEFEKMIWEPTEGGFTQLRLLVLQDLYLVKWMADKAHYPRLEHLLIQDCPQHKGIPCEIGDIPTLEIIELQGRSTDALLESAKIIREEQIGLGNDVFQVRINCYTLYQKRPWPSLG